MPKQILLLIVFQAVFSVYSYGQKNTLIEQGTLIEERFRKELKDLGLILPMDTTYSSYVSIRLLTDITGSLLKWRKICEISEVKDTPNNSSREFINIYGTNIYDKSLCDNLPIDLVPNCESLDNNCVTIGSSIFCDYKFIQRQRMLANMTYVSHNVNINTVFKSDIVKDTAFLKAMEIELRKQGFEGKIEDLINDLKKETPPKRYLPLDKRDVLVIANSQLNRKNEQHSNWKPDEIDGRIVGYANQGTSTDLNKETNEKILLSLVLAHELSHVEQNICSSSDFEIPNLSNNLIELAKLLDKKEGTDYFSSNLDMERINIDTFLNFYFSLTCQDDISIKEMYADINSVYYTKFYLDLFSVMTRSLYEINGGPKKDKLVEKVYKDLYGMYLFTIMRAMEYEFILGNFPTKERLEAIESEPAFYINGKLNFNETFLYYLNKESQRVINGEYITSRHIDPTIKLILILDQFKTLNKIHNKDPSLFGGSARLFGSISGRLVGLQVVHCDLEEKEAFTNVVIALKKYFNFIVPFIKD